VREQGKALVRALIETVINNRQEELAGRLVSPGYIGHNCGPQPVGINGRSAMSGPFVQPVPI